MTITELMVGAVSGTIKVRHSTWKGCQFFTPYFVQVNAIGVNAWFGTTTNVTVDGYIYDGGPYFIDSDSWELYKAPVAKLVLYEWILRDDESSRWQLHPWLETQAAIDRWVICNGYVEARKTGRQFEV